MEPRMSISFRLNALIVALLSVALLSFVLAMVLSAGPRIRAENDSMMRLAREFVETTIESLQGTTDPEAHLKVLLGGLKDLRHVRIYQAGDERAKQEPDSEDAGAAAWLARLAAPIPNLEIPVVVNGQSFGKLVISPRADHEAEEIWESIVTFTAVGLGLGAATVGFMSLMIARMLKPIRNVGDALLVLDSGRYDIAVPVNGPPEMADICQKLNRFAERLERTISENRRLAERIIFVQDEERKELSRELHDELGPYLFAIRAAVIVIDTEIKRGATDRPKLLEACATLFASMETIQRVNRRVLLKLRPLGLDEFGIAGKLAQLVAMLRSSHGELAINLSVADDMPKCDETTNLTIYRLVQEGLTNALKHSDAETIDVIVEPVEKRQLPHAMGEQTRPVVRVTIADDGRGLPPELKPSYGIAGMRERVWAAGGELTLSNRGAGGTMLEAWVPLAQT
jgi:two-component system, NarL family, sensor histidine kinase UhpB